jgi:hypothetical protein
LVLEHGDDLVKDGVLLITLSLFFSIYFTFGLKVSNGLIKGVLGLLQDLGGFGLLGEGGLDLGGASVSVDGLALVFGFQESEFSLG